MCDIQKEIGAIGKNEKNQCQHFNFRGIDTVYNELHDLLAKHEVFSTPRVIDSRHEERQSRNGATLMYRILTIEYTFYASDGSEVSCTVMGEGMDSGDKASNKAMSIAHKYALLQVFSIPTKEQKDPDAESHQVAPKPKTQAKTTNYDFLKVMKAEKDRIGEVAYRAVLKLNGFDKSNQITNRADQKKVYDMLIKTEKVEK